MNSRQLAPWVAGILLTSAGAATPAHALFLQTGDSLLAECTSGADGALDCLGYVAGVADTLAAGNVVNNAKACFPVAVTRGLLQDVVVKFLQLHREERHLAAVGLVAAALKEAFPCKQ